MEGEETKITNNKMRDEIEEVLRNRILDITDDYRGRSQKDKGGVSVYLGYPKLMIDEFVKLFNQLFSQKEVERIFLRNADPNERIRLVLALFEKEREAVRAKIVKIKKKAEYQDYGWGELEEDLDDILGSLKTNVNGKTTL